MAITVVLALVLSLVLALAGPVAASPIYNVSGNWQINVIYISVTYPETLSLTQSGTAITGVYLDTIPPASYFTITTGSVVGNHVVIDGVQGGLTVELVGDIANDGSMGGTWNDIVGGSRTGTWQSTSGQATQIDNAIAAQITGQIVAPTISMTAPGSINFQMFTFDVQKDLQTSGYGSVTVVPNSANHVNWQVTASGAKYMVQPSVAYLIDPLYISTDNVGWATADAGITYNGTDSISNLNFYAAQTVEPADPAGTYSDTVTFAVAITSFN